jgi:very-short-patch-repair endonuclease
VAAADVRQWGRNRGPGQLTWDIAQKGAPPDPKVAATASRQHGVVSVEQLHEAGLSDSAISGRVRLGRLHRVHRGVYAVGHRSLSFRGRSIAAVLALGDAFLSYRSAATLWGMLPVAPGPIDVSIASRTGSRRHRGIRVHRPRSLSPEHLTRRHGIPVTTPERTVADLRRTAAPAEARRAIRQAEVLGLPLGEEAGDRTRSELERIFLRLCRRYDLPSPEVNARVGARVADFLWRDQRLIVETDGYRYHRGRAAFEDDRARDLELRALGFEVVRLSYKQVAEETERVASILQALMGRPIHHMAEQPGPPEL